MLVLFNKPYGVLSQFTSDGGRWKTLAEYIDIPNVYAAGRLDADSEGLLLLTDNGVLQVAIAGSAASKSPSLRGAQRATQRPSAARPKVVAEPRNSPLRSMSNLPADSLGRHGLRPRDDELGSQRAFATNTARAVTKTYWAQVEGVATEEHALQLMRGVQLNDGPAKAIDARALGNIAEPWPRDPPIRVRKSVPDSWIELTLDEGRNRQVRRMTAAVGLPTLRLIRVAIGSWRVEGLALGAFRVIDDDVAFSALRRRR
jgi:pseudouridine synthase